MGYQQESYWPLGAILKIWWDEAYWIYWAETERGSFCSVLFHGKSSPISRSLK